ncbi:L-dopachrome tautomerase-related protein [Pseudomonas mucidolens]|jgi:sugar lactone lactonase YvrE|uniref:Sugar lactone lactonase YvrE n=1 Tax=Pseudomonas mucidolens TaxID=46679 RepID=A0A1H2M758_9PSED|nr:L-dopachrome tautomerase-related protein [Pseudomonas mucidolens]SDU89090.1 Sugar lactone lactonase YvrE [Pseudomonas mucidolens]SQH34407.1 gluconolactonase [Pseudomonas mucidolens]
MNTHQLEIFATFPVERPGNPTVMPDGRVLVSVSAIIAPDISVRAVAENGEHPAYPNETWAGKPGADGRGMSAVIGIRTDLQGIVWILDMGGPGQQPRLIAWNDREDRLHRLIVLPQNVLRPSSFTQDFVIDWRRQRIYIADMTMNPSGESDYPAIVVVDLQTGLSWRSLECYPGLMPGDVPLMIGGKALSLRTPEGEIIPYRYGLNPIAIDPLGRWVYFGSMSARKVYRVSTEVLAEPAGIAPLSEAVEYWCDKPHCDGFDVDAEGNVYVTDIANNAIGLASPAGYRILAQDDQLLAWPDGVELDAQGEWLYITANQLHRHPLLNAGEDDSQPPFHVLRLRVDAPMGSSEKP